MSNSNTNNHNEKPVSSAELTGLWRSAYPKISYDDLSKHQMLVVHTCLLTSMVLLLHFHHDALDEC